VSKEWDRGPRRRESDEDSYTPSFSGFEARDSGQKSSQALSGPPITGTVKWYSHEKGFGFVGLADGSGDAFLHGSVLERSGNGSVLPGSTLEVRVVPGPKGPQVKEVISVDTSTAQQELPRRPRPERPVYGGSNQATSEDLGTVKFYAAEKGFGFVSRDSGGKDAFVHATVLNRAGISGLTDGQRVAVVIGEGRKGPEVVSLRLF
jgi:CspA family cold shock protein